MNRAWKWAASGLRISVAVLTQLTTAAIAMLVGFAVFRDQCLEPDEILQATLSLILIVIIFNRFLPFRLLLRGPRANGWYAGCCCCGF